MTGSGPPARASAATATLLGPRHEGRLSRRLLRPAASVVVLGVVAVLVGRQALQAGTAVLSPVPLGAALLLGLVWRGLAATRWLVLARALGAPLPWWTAYAEYQRSELLNQVVPGGVVGDVDRARRHGTDVGLLTAARAVVLERAAGQVVLLVATVVAVLARPDLLAVAAGADRRTALATALLGAVVVGLVLLLWQPWRGPARGARAAAAALPARVLLRAGALGLALSTGVLACFVALFLLAARSTGSDAPVGLLVPAVLVVLVVSGIPLTVAGWGAREAGAALSFAAVGLAAADGVAASVGYGLLSLVAALPGVVVLLLPRRPTLRPDGSSGSTGSTGTGPTGDRSQVEVEADVRTEPEHP